MKTPPGNLHLDILELESAFEFLAAVDPDYAEGPCISFLDQTTGKVVDPEEEEIETLFGDKNFVQLPDDLFENELHGALDEFVDSLPNDPLHAELAQAISGRGAFRRFKDIIFGGGNVELKHRWGWLDTGGPSENVDIEELSTSSMPMKIIFSRFNLDSANLS